MTIKEELLKLFLGSIAFAAYVAYIKTIDLYDRVSDLDKRVSDLDKRVKSKSIKKDYDLENYEIPDITLEHLSSGTRR